MQVPVKSRYLWKKYLKADLPTIFAPDLLSHHLSSRHRALGRCLCITCKSGKRVPHHQRGSGFLSPSFSSVFTTTPTADQRPLPAPSEALFPFPPPSRSLEHCLYTALTMLTAHSLQKILDPGSRSKWGGPLLRWKEHMTEVSCTSSGEVRL